MKHCSPKGVVVNGVGVADAMTIGVGSTDVPSQIQCWLYDFNFNFPREGSEEHHELR